MFSKRSPKPPDRLLNGVPLHVGHVDEHPVPEDPGVVHEHVEPPEGLNGGIDETLGALPVRHVLAVGHRLAAETADLLHDLAGRPGRSPRPIDFSAEVVDDHLRTLAGQLDRLGSADPPACAGDDRHAPFTDPSSHRDSLLRAPSPGAEAK